MVKLFRKIISFALMAGVLLPAVTTSKKVETQKMNIAANFISYAPVKQISQVSPAPLVQTFDYTQDMTVAEDTQIEDFYAYSEEEKQLIARVVFAESRGEDQDGKIAVAQVVINRFESGRFGKSVKRVVFAKSQFAVSSRYTDECIQAVEAAIEERLYPGNMFYFRVSKRKTWRNFVYYDRIGNHSFYCSKG